MAIRRGDRVNVNLAPFIGSPSPSDQWIPCEVLEIDGLRVRVASQAPYRRVELWVPARWIQPAEKACLAATP